MGWSCSVRLINEDGNPLVDYKITTLVGFRAGGMNPARTDADGWAEIENEYIEDEQVWVKSMFVTLDVFPSLVTKKLITNEYIDNGESMSFTITSDDFDESD